MDGENNGKPLLKWDDLGVLKPTIFGETSTSVFRLYRSGHLDSNRWGATAVARSPTSSAWSVPWTIWDSRSPPSETQGVMMNYQPQTWSTFFFREFPSNLPYICIVSSFHPSKIGNLMTPVGFQHPPDVSHLGHLEGEQPRGLINHGYWPLTKCDDPPDISTTKYFLTSYFTLLEFDYISTTYKYLEKRNYSHTKIPT